MKLNDYCLCKKPIWNFFLQWPNLREWQSFRGNWPTTALAVGAIDGKSHEINRPVNNQEQFYYGHRHYHCIHTHIVVDNTGRISTLKVFFRPSK